MARLYGRAGRLTAKNGGSRPGQCAGSGYGPASIKEVTPGGMAAAQPGVVAGLVLVAIQVLSCRPPPP
jgi:hypothetical protein